VKDAYGIDLGTTYSVIATVGPDGRPTVLRNGFGAETTPSVVCFESPTSVLVGAAAKDAAPVLPDLTVALIKRQMGTDRARSFHGTEYSPESISSLILRALVDGAIRHRPADPLPVVVTVPAYFGIREREATQEACVLAGLEVLELVAEPVAAAIHYGVSAVDGAPVLVFDLGGGTFDATVLSFDGGPHAVATDGDTELGGADWDRRLAAFLLARYVETAAPQDDPEDDTAFMTELVAVAEHAKKALSGTTSHRVTLRRHGTSVIVTVTRAEFEAMTRDLVDSTLACLRRLLTAASTRGVGSIGRCLLVGGSSRMPMIADAIRAEFGWDIALHDPDLAVAKGAALRAAELIRTWVTPTWGSEAVPATPSPVDRSTHQGAGPSTASVVARGLGLLIQDSTDPSGTATFVEHVIHQNDPLPVVDRETVVATIVANQTAIRVEVYEQAGAVESRDTVDNRRVLDGELSGLPDALAAGTPVRVRLSLGRDGRLSVSATEPHSGATLTLEAYIDGVLDRADRLRMASGLRGLAVRQ
jgi:molecular chaperone DnaK